MRASILLWSTASGVILGLFIDATLVGLTVLASTAIPALSTRLHHRWMTTSAVLLLTVIPITLAVLGFLEGQLKTR